MSSPYAETYCPYCGAEEPHWNGSRSNPEWHDLVNKQDAEIERLRAGLDEYRLALEMIVMKGGEASEIALRALKQSSTVAGGVAE